MKALKLPIRVPLMAILAGGAIWLANPASAAEQPAASRKTAVEQAPAKKKQTSGPFHGKLAALDKQAATITVGKRTFQVVAATKITKAGKTATLNDGVLGETASGYFRMNEAGKLVLSSLRFGPKPEPEGARKGSAASE